MIFFSFEMHNCMNLFWWFPWKKSGTPQQIWMKTLDDSSYTIFYTLKVSWNIKTQNRTIYPLQTSNETTSCNFHAVFASSLRKTQRLQKAFPFFTATISKDFVQYDKIELNIEEIRTGFDFLFHCAYKEKNRKKWW